MNKNDLPKYLTVTDVMKLLGISRPTVYKMIREGKLDAINSGKKYIIPLWQPALKKGDFNA